MQTCNHPRGPPTFATRSLRESHPAKQIHKLLPDNWLTARQHTE